MICALTVRTLKSGSFEEFREAFMRHEDPENAPAGFSGFHMIRNVENPDEVICFGFFDGTVDELRSAAAEQNYEQQTKDVAPFVESVGADGLYEVVERH
jgi:heme-degrading monooxygenase HmoA